MDVLNCSVSSSGRTSGHTVFTSALRWLPPATTPQSLKSSAPVSTFVMTLHLGMQARHLRPFVVAIALRATPPGEFSAFRSSMVSHFPGRDHPHPFAAVTPVKSTALPSGCLRAAGCSLSLSVWLPHRYHLALVLRCHRPGWQVAAQKPLPHQPSPYLPCRGGGNTGIAIVRAMAGWTGTACTGLILVIQSCASKGGGSTIRSFQARSPFRARPWMCCTSACPSSGRMPLD